MAVKVNLILPLRSPCGLLKERQLRKTLADLLARDQTQTYDFFSSKRSINTEKVNFISQKYSRPEMICKVNFASSGGPERLSRGRRRDAILPTYSDAADPVNLTFAGAEAFSALSTG